LSSKSTNLYCEKCATDIGLMTLSKSAKNTCQKTYTARCKTSSTQHEKNWTGLPVSCDQPIQGRNRRVKYSRRTSSTNLLVAGTSQCPRPNHPTCGRSENASHLWKQRPNNTH
jgi:hypothetical protein